MKFILSTAVAMALIALTQAQGLQEKFDNSCECWVVTNHYDNGQLSSIHHENKARQKHGEAKQYNTEGHILREEVWKNGKLHGKTLAYHPDGNVYLESEFDNGAKVGTWTFKDTDGTLMQEIIYEGKNSDGTYLYYRAGVKYLEQIVVAGQLAETNILNQELYDAAMEEAAAVSK